MQTGELLWGCKMQNVSEAWGFKFKAKDTWGMTMASS